MIPFIGWRNIVISNYDINFIQITPYAYYNHICMELVAQSVPCAGSLFITQHIYLYNSGSLNILHSNNWFMWC